MAQCYYHFLAGFESYAEHIGTLFRFILMKFLLQYLLMDLEENKNLNEKEAEIWLIFKGELVNNLQFLCKNPGLFLFPFVLF